MTTYPLLRNCGPDSVIAFRRQQPITAAKFLHDSAALAALLLSHRHVINLCTDRYRFTVGIAAALLRRQTSLLPPNDMPGTLAQIAERFPDLYCLTDSIAELSALPSLHYPEAMPPLSTPPATPAFPGTQEAVVLFTSGSTGRHEPHARSWGALVRSARAAAQQIGSSALAGATILGTVPHQHSYGLESTVMLALQHGFALHAERPFFPGDICAALEKAPRPRILVTTPIHLDALLAGDQPLPICDLIVSATAPLSSQTAAQAEARFGAQLHEIYGCTEVGQIAARRTAQTATWRCLNGIRLREDSRGIWAGGEPIDVEMLLNDLIELQSPNEFLLLGRKADLINIAGKRTSLAHLNYHLKAIKGVEDGVFFMPDETIRSLTRLTALVVAPTLSAETILSALRERIDPAFLPRPLHLVAALPRNELGKLPRDRVAELAMQAGK